MNGPDSQRRDELLDLAEQLSKRLQSVEVPYLADPSALSTGVPASVVAHATSYLARARDIGRFREFLARFDQLDRMTAQNPDNPKADHRVLRGELEALLADRPDLSAEELLYLLSWVRRLLPKVPEEGPAAPPTTRPESNPAPFKGGQLAAALEQARSGGSRRLRGEEGSRAKRREE